MIFEQAVFRNIERYFKLRNIGIPEDNIRQAYIPEGARYLVNQAGTAPGLIIEEKGTTLIALPGPPKELIPLVERHLIPYLKRYNGRWAVVSRTIKTTGITEAEVGQKIKDILAGAWREFKVQVGIYAHTAEVLCGKECCSQGTNQLRVFTQ